MAKKWNDFSRKGIPDIGPFPKLGKRTKIVAMGSCFAVEIKKALTARGYGVLPTEMSDRLSIDFAWYTPDSIEQEVLMACNPDKQIRDEGDIWHGPCKPGLLKYNYVYQDPYRRHCYENTIADLYKRIEFQDNMMNRSFKVAGLFIFTMGLIESWIMESGMIPCLPPNQPNKLVTTDPRKFSGKASPRLLTYEKATQCIFNIVNTIRLVLKSDAPIIFSLSPVPLGRTYRGIDISMANCISKSTLRLAINDVVSDYSVKGVYYLPSYEIVTYIGRKAYTADTRHILPEVVERIVNLFMERSGAK